MSESYINQGLKGLASRNYITKKKRGEYWINPSYSGQLSWSGIND